MKFEPSNRPDLETLAAVIARSPIVVMDDRALARLPAGFDKVDVAILRWIAADSRRTGHSRRPN